MIIFSSCFVHSLENNCIEHMERISLSLSDYLLFHDHLVIMTVSRRCEKPKFATRPQHARPSVIARARAYAGRICRRSGMGGEFNKLAFPSSAQRAAVTTRG